MALLSHTQAENRQQRVQSVPAVPAPRTNPLGLGTSSERGINPFASEESKPGPEAAKELRSKRDQGWLLHDITAVKQLKKTANGQEGEKNSA